MVSKTKSDQTAVSGYDPVAVERSAQSMWDDAQSFVVDESVPGEKFYCLAMFPYPSGQLHMGHVKVYTLADVINRYKRLKGFNVMQPVGWDAFGLPAENAAIKHDIPPAKWTMANIDNMRGQMKQLGFGLDWTREFATCDPDYYRWEQWFFLKLYEKGMVYRKSAVVNWDPVDQTVLANEQVIDGRGWRSDALIERREMQQWFLKITAYADELVDKLDDMTGWPESVKHMQRNWIGRSEGVEIDFAVQGDTADATDSRVTVYTTRPDTLLGATYLAVAPEHPLARQAAAGSAEVQAFVDACKNMKSAEAELATMEKAGVDTGITVAHPLTGERLPVWTANFVLMEYGSGAVMSVPGHDQRDWEFAKKYGIPIKQVIEPVDDAACDLTTSAFTSNGRLVNSEEYSGLTSVEAFEAIAQTLETDGNGRRQTNYRLRDWGVSRQRYWGCPIPMIHCADCGVVPVPEVDLPVVLPIDVQFQGVRSPLTTMDSFLNVACPKCGSPAKRETDTFDTFMESSWYYARFACPDSNQPMLDERAKLWTPVDHYVGGIEHAILHLLYARFFHKLMRDADLVDSDEPFTNLLMLGMVLHNGKKMSKSAGDAGDPQVLLDRFGADAVRAAMMVAAPPEQSFEWNESGVEAQNRYIRRVWQLMVSHVASGTCAPISDLSTCAQLSDGAKSLRRKTHQTIARADDDYGRRLHFNTVVSACHELAAAVKEAPTDTEYDRAAVAEALYTLVTVLSPIAPHATEMMWQALGGEGLLVDARWPTLDESALEQAEITLVVQVNGKVRGRINVAADLAEEAVKELALAEENVVRSMADKSIRKVIYVPGRLVNVVVG